MTAFDQMTAIMAQDGIPRSRVPDSLSFENITPPESMRCASNGAASGAASGVSSEVSPEDEFPFNSNPFDLQLIDTDLFMLNDSFKLNESNQIAVNGDLNPVSNVLTLQSNVNPAKDFPNYISHTHINTNLLKFLKVNYFNRLSTNEKITKPWIFLIGEFPLYPYTMNISMSVALLSLYYDSLQLQNFTEVEPVLQLSDPDQYKNLLELHFKEFVSGFDIYKVTQSRDLMELFSYIASNILHLLYYVLAPNYSMCDPTFYSIMSTGSKMYQDLMPYVVAVGDSGLKVDSTTAKNVERRPTIYVPEVCLDLFYYRAKSQKAPENLAPGFFFPEYLFSMVEVQDFDTQSSAQLLQLNSEALLESINTLKSEYTLVHNAPKSERDSLRVLLRWPLLVPCSFVKLLESQDQRALIVVAHFILLLLSLEYEKIIPNIMLQQEISVIESVLDENWAPWISVPKRAVGLPDL